MPDIEFEKRGSLVSREKIMDIRDQAKEAAEKVTGRKMPDSFDPTMLYQIEDDVFVNFRKELEAVERRYRENTELWGICEMALLYLDHVENERAVKEDK